MVSRYVVGKADRRGNLYPMKSRPDQKIDAAVALMMAVGRAMTEDQNAGLDGFLFPVQSSHRLIVKLCAASSSAHSTMCGATAAEKHG
jgi:phage terminase large subunit-like protein